MAMELDCVATPSRLWINELEEELYRVHYVKCVWRSMSRISKSCLTLSDRLIFTL